MSENYPNEYNRYLFHKGENYHSYKFLGNHLFQKKEKKIEIDDKLPVNE